MFTVNNFYSFDLQERAGVKMVMIQDGPQNTGADKPLRISGEPFKVQVGHCRLLVIIIVCVDFKMIFLFYLMSLHGFSGVVLK